ncbi:tRNA lysidine(34) synthetase TilS [Lacimicrobium sp. SS2-24]|uniref:tRNA lysidine(34) synthetase TilS n=1 Tax=Lacimicrobium sp. SS2-24 TaxID=2005569 RepID=UPI000B4A67E6|nr:tRNA lysidine(34) synthetase TilS [Lacimicrobium sp. SS2-24]
MLYTHFEAQLLSYLTPAQPLYVAYSGGLDSHVVLHLASRFVSTHPQHTCHAVHIHHGLSPHADSWQKHCARVCEDMAIPFLSHRLALQHQQGESLEAQARNARYQALANLIPAGAMVLLGQHQQDQVETLLLQLKRGAGPKGLSGMAVYAPKDDLHYIRPLLACDQQQLCDYARQHHLHWVEDESNEDKRFDRNFLRHEVLPLLTNRWPGVQKAIARSAELCAQQHRLLEEQSRMNLEQVMADDQTLRLPALMKFSELWRKHMIRSWLAELGVPMPPQAMMHRIESELIHAREDACPSLVWGDWQLRRFDRHVYLLPSQMGASPEPLCWRKESQLRLCDGRHIIFVPGTRPDASSGWLGLKAYDELNIEFSGWSQAFRPAGAKQSKPLKQWFRIWKVPPWQRPYIPLLRHGGELVAVVGYAVSQGCEASGERDLWVAIR